jgi:hypothetical protein
MLLIIYTGGVFMRVGIYNKKQCIVTLTSQVFKLFNLISKSNFIISWNQNYLYFNNIVFFF